jgi:plastocyanin
MELLQNLWNGSLDITKLLVSPDGGALIALLPVFMGVVVILFVLSRLFQYRRLGPKRRRPGRIAPVTPPGVHMPGPTYAPFFAAGGAFLLFLGLVFPGPWLFIGIAGMVLGLLYWGREGLRDYDHVAGDEPQLPAVIHEGPPPGVHMPGPSFRPILASLGVFVLFLGLVFPGPILAVGLLFLVAALLGWLNDARKEYRHVVVADATGHIENEPAPSWPKTLVSVFTLLIIAAVALDAGWFPPRSAQGEGGPGSSGAPAGSGGPAGSGAPGAGGLTIVAQNVKFDTAALSTAADKAFTITLDNKDAGTPHDADILDSTGAVVVNNKDFPGPAVETYDVPPLKAGTYKFECSIHPALMNGTLTVGG